VCFFGGVGGVVVVTGGDGLEGRVGRKHRVVDASV